MFSSLLVYNCLYQVSYDPLYFCGISCNFSSFVSDFIYMNFLFFLVNLAKVCKFCLSLLSFPLSLVIAIFMS